MAKVVLTYTFEDTETGGVSTRKEGSIEGGTEDDSGREYTLAEKTAYVVMKTLESILGMGEKTAVLQ